MISRFVGDNMSSLDGTENLIRLPTELRQSIMAWTDDDTLWTLMDVSLTFADDAEVVLKSRYRV